MEKSNVDMLLAGHLHMGYSGDVRTHFEAAKRSDRLLEDAEVVALVNGGAATRVL